MAGGDTAGTRMHRLASWLVGWLAGWHRLPPSQPGQTVDRSMAVCTRMPLATENSCSDPPMTATTGSTEATFSNAKSAEAAQRGRECNRTAGQGRGRQGGEEAPEQVLGTRCTAAPARQK